MIPLVDLSLNSKLSQLIKKAIADVIKSKNYVLGANVERFEKEFARYVGTKYAVGVASGTDALRLSLMALGVGRGDKVLIPSLTSPFTAIAIVEEAAVPVFCDVDEKTFTIDAYDAEKRIDKKTKAIIPVHLFGNPSNIDTVLKLAKKYKLKVIEDACQAHGAKYRGEKVGKFGDAAAFSFYPTKNLGALGDGGMVVTNDAKVALLVKSLRHGGQTKRFWHKFRGINSRLDEIQAAILGVKLKYLDGQNQKRRQLAENYRQQLSGLPLKFQEEHLDAESVYHLFVIKTKKRKSLQKFLNAAKIASDIYYPYPVHLQSGFRQFADGKLPITEKLTKELLAIPIGPNLKRSEQLHIIRKIKDFFAQHK